MIKRPFSVHHVETDQRMLHIDVMNRVYGTLDLVLVQIRHSHDENIRFDIPEQPISYMPLVYHELPVIGMCRE